MTKQIPFLAKIEIAAEAANTAPTRFTILAYTGGKLRVAGYDVPVVVDLAGLKADGQIPIVIKHNTDVETTFGQTDEDGVENDGRQLVLRGDITGDATPSPVIDRVIAMAVKGHNWQASIGAQPEETVDIDEGEVVEVNGQTLEGPFVLATSSTLRETSVTGMGADKKTRVILAESKDCKMDADALTGADDDGFEAWVEDAGFDKGSLTEKGRNILLQQYAAETKDQNDEVDADANTDEEKKTDEEESSGDDANTDSEKEDKVEAEEDEESKEGETDDDNKPPTDKKTKGKPMAATGKVDIKAEAENQISEARKAQADEMRRVGKIRSKFGADPDLCATAIERGWSFIKAENEFLKRQDRKRAPAGHVRTSTPQDIRAALQGTLILRAGGKIDHEVYTSDQAQIMAYVNASGDEVRLPQWLRAGVNSDMRQKVMEASWEFRDISMVDLCKLCCEIDGRTPTSRSNSGFIRAAVSGGSLPDIFTTNINALLLQKLLEHPDTTAGWTREADAANFQPMERTRLTKGPRLSLLARGGEADNAQRSDVMQSYKISRYAQQFRVDEQDMIDDRFQAFADIPNEMGLACGRLRPDIVYTILLSNPNINKEDGTSSALFSASQPGSQSNYVASGAALASGTLQTGLATMFNILENNVPVDATPTHLLIPAVLFGTACNLLQSPTIVVAGTAGTVTTKGGINELQKMQEAWGMIKPVSDSRLTNGVIDPTSGPAQTSYAGSSTRWFLVSNKCPTIEVAYLRGSGRAPQVRQFVLQEGKWGLGFDVNMDIGAKAIDWHGMYSANQ